MSESKNKFLAGLKQDAKIIRKFFHMAKILSPSCLRFMFVVALFESVTPFVSVIVPKLIIDELLGQRRIQTFFWLVGGAVAVSTTLTFITSWLRRRYMGACLELQEKCRIYLGNRIMKRDYEDLEDPELLDTKNKAVVPLLEGGIWGFYSSITNLISGVFSLAGLTALISTLNAGIILLIVLMVLINMALYQKSRAIQYELEKEQAVIHREWDYFENLTGDFSVGKDIRLYGMQELLLKKMSYLRDKIRGVISGICKKSARLDGVTRANSQLQMVFVYAYLIYRVLYKGLSIGNFTMYSSAAANFSNVLSRFFETLVWGRQAVRRAEPFLDFVDIHPRKSSEGLSTQGITQCKIEFRNVTFRYPRSNTDSLKDVSLCIEAGEKLSVVGLNGAGKTTFIKLLTRLYDPDEGEILLNGVNIREYGYEDYLKLLAVVFQDFKTFSVSIKENIALSKAGDVTDGQILDVLEKAGLARTVEALPKGADTMLYKIFDENGIEFSGGQNQKLAIARALFKDAPIVVLDEPTAALDPISEYEIYSRFNTLVGDKTAIYISHRLSSCRFCDRIVVFSDGRIVQQGTHAQLLEEETGLYCQMYQTQAKHYA